MTSFIILHIMMAVGSVVSVTVLFSHPTHAKLLLSYAMLALTTATGIYLVAMMQTNIAGVCIFGICFIAALLTGIALAQKKLSIISIGS